MRLKTTIQPGELLEENLRIDIIDSTKIRNSLTECFYLRIPACSINMGAFGDLGILVELVHELLGAV